MPISTFVKSAGVPQISAESHFYAENLLDFSATNVVATDVVEAIAVEARTFIHTVIVDVVTAEGGTATAEVGDGADPNGWAAGVDFNAAALSKGAGAYCMQTAGGKLYTADDTIDVTVNNDLDAAKVRIIVIGVYLPAVTSV